VQSSLTLSAVHHHHHTGHIILKRQEGDFRAAFCLLRGDLPFLEDRLRVLHPTEKAHYESLKFGRRKQSYLLGRIAAKTAVSTLLQINDPASFYIGFGVFNFPVVKGLRGNTQVSISHCDDTGIALAFPEEHPMGLDIEEISDRRLDAIESQLSGEEKKLLQDCGVSPATGFTLAWTIKEALSKVLKTGLTVDFKILEINSIKSSGAAYTSTFRYYDQYKAISCHSGDYACSVILPRKTTADLDPFFACFAKTVSAAS
jgi:4'-phosphopantetheinyl transferase